MQRTSRNLFCFNLDLFLEFSLQEKILLGWAAWHAKIGRCFWVVGNSCYQPLVGVECWWFTIPHSFRKEWWLLAEMWEEATASIIHHPSTTMIPNSPRFGTRRVSRGENRFFEILPNGIDTWVSSLPNLMKGRHGRNQWRWHFSRFWEVHCINSIHFCVTQLKGYKKYQMIHGSISRKKLVDLWSYSLVFFSNRAF